MREITKETREFQAISDNLRRVGIELLLCPGQYRINYLRAAEATACYFETLLEAEAAGYRMAETASAPTPPVGPCGRKNTRRGQMFRHNTKLLQRGFWRKGRA